MDAVNCTQIVVVRPSDNGCDGEVNKVRRTVEVVVELYSDKQPLKTFVQSTKPLNFPQYQGDIFAFSARKITAVDCKIMVGLMIDSDSLVTMAPAKCVYCITLGLLLIRAAN